MTPRREIVKVGEWLYDGSVPRTVCIIKQNFDPYYWPEEGDSPLAESLNTEGESYTVAFRDVTSEWRAGSERAPLLSLEKAVQLAEELVGPVKWKQLQPVRLQPDRET